MLVYTIRRWDAAHTKNEVTNRVDTSKWKIVYDWVSNTTSSFTIANPLNLRNKINPGDFLYAPDHKYVGLIKEYDEKTGELTVGHIFNAYQFPVQKVYNTMKFTSIASEIQTRLTAVNGVYPGLKLDMINWTFDVQGNTDATIHFGDGNDNLNVLTWWDYASKLMVNSRGTNVPGTGLRVYATGITNTSDKGIQINMKLDETATTQTDFKYDITPESKKNRVIQNLVIEDKKLTHNAVVMFDSVTGDNLGTYFLDMGSGQVVTSIPNKSQWPIYYSGYLYDQTNNQPNESKPTLLQAATAQLPVNQSDNFSFTMNATQRLVPVDSVMAGTRITINVVDDKNISQRTLVGVVSTLEVTESLITVKVGMLRPRLTLTI